MAEDPRLDPEMRAFNAMMEAAAQRQPPIRLTLPFDEPRALTEALNLPLAEGGPTMAESTDRWLPLRGRRIQCRVHRPSRGTGPLPVLVYLHGGGWVWNSIDTHDRLMREYAAAAGCAVIGPDYALSPEAAFPQALEECAGVAAWVAAHGAEWGLDPARIVLGGDSAGANLAAGAALLLREAAKPVALRGLLLNYGVFDSRLDTPSYREFATGYGLTLERMEFYWRSYAPREADRLSPLAAPLRGDLAGLPPCLLQIAELDVLASENLAMADRLRQAGVAVEAAVIPGTVHGFLRAIGHVGAARQAVAAAGQWLQARLS
ncbi:alpha/beta hydrolase fold domain-containing protein [Siccirubricoccus sp. G192]|uniref:alpha/beta hydrolase fold domain-containing protein n=1 Tax=Siccirubricoccus sp. G192 TaxID=2849651 RepID=UPI001C2BD4AB|nr:alpha/beta hydrolase [Siccirubricoccus sp. G192]MBV1798643.1 alpha/beta hydrolase [Siccirubricoccus sp. G192]